MNPTNKKKGDCECCTNSVNVDIFLCYNMWMCESCKADEDKAQAERVSPANQQARIDSMNATIARSRQIDNSIQVKPDIFNAATVEAIQIKAAIQADESLTPEQKAFKLAKEMERHLNHMQEVIFKQQQELVNSKSVAMMWQTETQLAIGQLRVDLREQFNKNLVLDYNPVKPKKIKPEPVKMTAGQRKELVKKMSDKYGVPVEMIALVMKSRNMSPEEAAREMAKNMGLSFAGKSENN